MTHPNKNSAGAGVWLKALRAYSLPASVVPLLFGVAYAHWRGFPPSWWALPLVLLAGILVHLGTNLINDVVDFQKGVDRADTMGGSGVLVAGELSVGQVRAAAIGTFAASAALGLVLVYSRGSTLLYLGLAGVAGGWFYTAPPLMLKYRAMGEPLVFAMMGPLMIAGAALAATGVLPPGVWLASVPVGLLVTAVLSANNVRDLEDDRRRGVRTLANLTGHGAGKAQYAIFLLGAYAAVPALAAAGQLPWWCMLAWLTLPLGLMQAVAVLRSTPRSFPEMGVERTAQLHMLFGVLLVVGLFIG